jgi:hypothetical protein
MANTLHIEMLCEGPICTNFGSDDFWKLRYSYFESELGVPKLGYYDKTIKEIVQLEDLSSFTEVVLWFEFDLFCQVNLMALCSYLLESFRKDITYKLVCTGLVKGKERLQSLSDFNLNKFEGLYESSIKITKNNLEFSKECWNVYVENDFQKLQAFDFNKQRGKFQYFQKAIDQHLLRFQDKNGLNQIQHKILEIINSEPLTSTKIVKNLLIWQANETVYGFGDLQYFQYLKKLNKYYKISNSIYFLNEKGKAIYRQ